MKGASMNWSPSMYNATGELREHFDVTVCIPGTPTCQTFKTMSTDNPTCLGERTVLGVGDNTYVSVFNPSTSVYEMNNASQKTFETHKFYCKHMNDISKGSFVPSKGRTAVYTDNNGMTYYCPDEHVGHNGYCYKPQRINHANATKCVTRGVCSNSAAIRKEQERINEIHRVYDSNIKHIWPQEYWQEWIPYQRAYERGEVSWDTYKQRSNTVYDGILKQREQLQEDLRIEKLMQLKNTTFGHSVMDWAYAQHPFSVHTVYDPTERNFITPANQIKCPHPNHIATPIDGRIACLTKNQLVVMGGEPFAPDEASCDNVYAGDCRLYTASNKFKDQDEIVKKMQRLKDLRTVNIQSGKHD